MSQRAPDACVRGVYDGRWCGPLALLLLVLAYVGVLVSETLTMYSCISKKVKDLLPYKLSNVLHMICSKKISISDASHYLYVIVV